MTRIEALEYLTEVYTDNEYAEDEGWTFEDFLADVADNGEEGYSETVVAYQKMLQD